VRAVRRLIDTLKIGKSAFDLSDGVNELSDSLSRETLFFAQTRRMFSRNLAWWRGQVLKPLEQHASRMGIDGAAERQAIISRP
jgi:hypothetical protein